MKINTNSGGPYRGFGAVVKANYALEGDSPSARGWLKYTHPCSSRGDCPRYPSVYQQLRFSLVVVVILLITLSFGCTSDGKAAEGGASKDPGNPGTNLAKLFDKDNLWASNRKLAEAVAANPFEYTGITGAIAYFRLLYLADVKGAAKAIDMATGGDMLREWPQPGMLGINLLSAISSCDDILALGSNKGAALNEAWLNFANAYGVKFPDSISNINTTMATVSGTVKYEHDASGFYSGVDHQASICGFVAVYEAEGLAGFDPGEVLLARFENWKPDIPENAEGQPDLVGLMEAYDIVTYPYFLDYIYMKTGNPELYYAMLQILTAYADAVNIEGLGGRIDASPEKERVLGQLCVLARLFRRMNAFTDEDIFIDAAEGLLAEIAPESLTGTFTSKLAFLHSLAFVTEPSLHIVITGPSSDSNWGRFADISRDRYEPRLALMPLDSAGDAELIDEIGYYPTEEPRCFVCVDTDCFPPLAKPDELEALIEKAYKTMAEVRDKELAKMKGGE